MAECLGLYIEENIIKYAKVSKERDNIKIESFGIKFYENLTEAIDQVIEETYSYKTPISINLSDEMYNYFNMFSLLSKKDLQKAIQVEFESYCTEKGYNPNVFESRYALVNNIEDDEKIKVVHVSANKMEINKKLQEFSKYRLTNISPISVAISNIADIQPKQNVIIVNIEDKTRITTIIDEKIYDVETIEEGSEQILRKINLKENSFSKSYEICKNTTIYTADGKELGEDTQGHLEDIMPTLYNIVGKVQKIINESLNKIDTVYITGTAAIINNVDLYFQEYLSYVKCEILKPYFLKKLVKEINIKDYIEVNSAIAMALQALGEGVEGMNFKKNTLTDKINNITLKPENPKNKAKTKEKNKSGLKLNFDFSAKLDGVEYNLLRTAIGIIIFIIVFAGFSTLLSNQIEKKQNEVTALISSTNAQINLVKSDTNEIKKRKNEYSTLIQNLQELSDRLNDRNRNRNAIPNLLYEIMTVIPKDVQITSIVNESDRHIVITTEAEEYQQIGYFKSTLSTEGILTDVISNSGVKQGEIIKVTIEGDLP